MGEIQRGAREVAGRYLILTVSGVRFRFSREPGHPELLHIFARHTDGAQARHLGLV
jgi:hypothetical protein